MSKVKFTDIPRHFKRLPHQVAALNFLQDNTPGSVQGQFTEMWRSAVPDKVQDVPNNWAGIALAAKEAGARYPDLVAAQWALESGWGKHLTGTHNVFGQKGSPGTWLVPSEGGPAVEFLDFPSFRASVQYLVDRWHKDFKGFTGVNHAQDRDAAARMLLAEGYVGIPPQNPKYAIRLSELMRENAPTAVAPPAPAPAPAPPAAKVTLSSPFSARLAPDIRLGEFALDQEARRFVAQHQVDTAGELAAFLQRIRAQFGAAVNLSSGYRPPAINRSVGGASDSEHLYSRPREGAVDFWMTGVDMQEVYRWCNRNWPHSLGDASYKPVSGRFIHLGRRANGERRRWNY